MKQKEIIITAPEIYSAKLKRNLTETGFKVFQFPTAEIMLCDNEQFNLFFKKLKSCNYIILPSRNAIKSFVNQAEKYKISSELLKKQNYVTIGRDEEYLKRFNLKNKLKTTEASTDGIFEALKKIKNLKKTVVFIPKTENMTEPDIIPDFISKLQTISDVDCIKAYITKPKTNYDREISEKIKQSDYDLIAFTSGGEIEALKSILNNDKLFHRLKVACFGPYTESTALKNGLKPEITGLKFDAFKDFAETLKNYFYNRNTVKH